MDNPRFAFRSIEFGLLCLALLLGFLGFILTAAGLNPDRIPALFPDVLRDGLPLVVVGIGLFGLHLLLSLRGVRVEQILLPAAAFLLVIGMVMIYRLQDVGGVWQQTLRGFVPGVLVCAVLAARPVLVERMRRLAIPMSLVGLALPFITALFGEVDETGVRLALKLGPLPSIQTSELLKPALILFLAWYIEREGRRVEGRARPLFGYLRLPSLWYFLPGALFAALGALALVAMSDYGAVIILAVIFIGMLYAGFAGRTFTTVAVIGLLFAALAAIFLALFWTVPDLIRYRFVAFRDPWSEEILVINGQPTEITVSEGPGYQIQQAVYAVIAGGVSGAGLGMGSPSFVPLAHSDFIFAAVVEELGAAGGFAVLLLFAVLLVRILRTAALLPEAQVFERLLLVGIAVHLFIQVFYMVGGTLNLVPVTGITIPFMSLGGTALLVNLSEVGIVLALMQRVET